MLSIWLWSCARNWALILASFSSARSILSSRILPMRVSSSFLDSSTSLGSRSRASCSRCSRSCSCLDLRLTTFSSRARWRNISIFSARLRSSSFLAVFSSRISWRLRSTRSLSRRLFIMLRCSSSKGEISLSRPSPEVDVRSTTVTLPLTTSFCARMRMISSFFASWSYTSSSARFISSSLLFSVISTAALRFSRKILRLEINALSSTAFTFALFSLFSCTMRSPSRARASRAAALSSAVFEAITFFSARLRWRALAASSAERAISSRRFSTCASRSASSSERMRACHSRNSDASRRLFSYALIAAISLACFLA
eukprot:comp16303_c0_seq1/m.25917 comp16303_c0_seq1/g.25917  ORF comp16303_c0_seq1/g.25917 comp16303_c0_seq1/m.25917 type:complete len:314 (+) comp16303_c0_seq1:466-1407(+)